MLSMDTICFLVKLFFLNQRLIEYLDKGIKNPGVQGSDCTIIFHAAKRSKGFKNQRKNPA